VQTENRPLNINIKSKNLIACVRVGVSAFFVSAPLTPADGALRAWVRAGAVPERRGVQCELTWSVSQSVGNVNGAKRNSTHNSYTVSDFPNCFTFATTSTNTMGR
jgi:hypothetical protein